MYSDCCLPIVASDFHEQDGGQHRVFFVVGKFLPDNEPITRKLQRPMALFTGFASEPQLLHWRRDGVVIIVKRYRENPVHAG